MSDDTNTPEHLRAHRSGRGLAYMPTILGGYGAEVAVYESSADSGPYLWLMVTVPEDSKRPEGPKLDTMVHLPAEAAWQIAGQIRHLVEHHYQGDARPDPGEVPDASTR